VTSEESRAAVRRLYDGAISTGRAEDVEAEPTSAALWFVLAKAYFASSRLGRAETAFERVVELDPTDDQARFGIGRALERQSRHAEALAQYRIAFALSPEADYADALRRVEARLAAGAAVEGSVAGAGGSGNGA
jgi:tetratricopeptide (TPR) repeat protein